MIPYLRDLPDALGSLEEGYHRDPPAFPENLYNVASVYCSAAIIVQWPFQDLHAGGALTREVTEKKRVLAIASGGGHWEQLMLLRGALEGHEVVFATTIRGLAERAGVVNGEVIPDCNRHQVFRSLRCAAHLAWIMIKFRPDVIVSTGALPGVIGLALGRLAKCRNIWIDSIANASAFSMAGEKARSYADVWLSQWQHVAQAAGATYVGSVL